MVSQGFYKHLAYMWRYSAFLVVWPVFFLSLSSSNVTLSWILTIAFPCNLESSLYASKSYESYLAFHCSLTLFELYIICDFIMKLTWPFSVVWQVLYQPLAHMWLYRGSLEVTSLFQMSGFWKYAEIYQDQLLKLKAPKNKRSWICKQ